MTDETRKQVADLRARIGAFLEDTYLRGYVDSEAAVDILAETRVTLAYLLASGDDND